jgi:hypothetical protein
LSCASSHAVRTTRTFVCFTSVLPFLVVSIEDCASLSCQCAFYRWVLSWLDESSCVDVIVLFFFVSSLWTCCRIQSSCIRRGQVSFSFYYCCIKKYYCIIASASGKWRPHRPVPLIGCCNSLTLVLGDRSGLALQVGGWSVGQQPTIVKNLCSGIQLFTSGQSNGIKTGKLEIGSTFWNMEYTDFISTRSSLNIS